MHYRLCHQQGYPVFHKLYGFWENLVYWLMVLQHLFYLCHIWLLLWCKMWSFCYHQPTKGSEKEYCQNRVVQIRACVLYHRKQLIIVNCFQATHYSYFSFVLLFSIYSYIFLVIFFLFFLHIKVSTCLPVSLQCAWSLRPSPAFYCLCHCVFKSVFCAKILSHSAVSYFG